MQVRTGIITISDRAAQGAYDDRSGPALKAAAEGYGWTLVSQAVVADDKSEIQRAVRDQITRGCELILTTGGTGVGPRDVTPEAVREIGGRELPGFGEVMRRESFEANPNAILSRSLALVTGRTLVICLPGKPQGAVECVGYVAAAVPHCLEVIGECPTSC